MSTHVVVATDVAAVDDAGERLLQLLRWLARRDVHVEVVALGEGTRPDLRRYRSIARTVVLDRFRRRGLARPFQLIGWERPTHAIKAWRLRRWLRRRSDATFLIHHPDAACLLRYARTPPRRIVAAFPDPRWSFEQMRPVDRTTLNTADAWLTCTAEQSAAVAAEFDGPVLELGANLNDGTLIDPDELLSVTADRSGDVVVLTSVGAWDTIDHAVELSWRLRGACPDLMLRWVVDSADDRWLAEHDLHHAGLDDSVRIVRSDSPELLEGVSLVVRTGYEPTQRDVALAAALAGVAVCGMCTTDLPASAVQTAPLDVDDLVDTVVALVKDPEASESLGQELSGQLADVDLAQQIDQLVALLSGGPR